LFGRVPKAGWWRTRTWAAVVALLVVGCGPDAEQGEQEGDEASATAAVMEHELDEETLWISEEGDAEQAAAEFLEHVLGWPSEPVARVTEGSEEMMLEPTTAMIDAEGPDGQPLLLQMRRGEPQYVGEPPGDDTHRWHVESVTTDETPAQTLDEDTHTLVVHRIPEEQHHSALLLHVEGETSAHLLDDGELQPGADTAEIDLAALGVEEFEPDPNSFLLTTALLLHFDEDGQTLGAEGHPIRAQPTPR
jgi:hypothetical protein